MAKQESTITEIKTYKCSDGKVYDDKEMAEKHEEEIKDPTYSIIERVRKLEIDLANTKNEIASLKTVLNTLRTSDWGYRPMAVLNGKEAEDVIEKLFGGIK